MSVRVFAPAKLNLSLEVGAAKPESGRHPLQSAVAFADVGDWIEAAPAPEGISLRIEGPFGAQLTANGDNLVLRAAAALAADAPGRAAVLTLTKKLPVAAGIGGGSSDAAATLKALNALWELGLSEAELIARARPLGGDVPVCVFGRSAYMTGEGETVAPLDLPVLDGVLVNPGVAVSTAEVFARFDAMAGGARFMSSAAPVWRSLADVCEGARERGNALAAPAREIAPVIADVERELAADTRARLVALSGSGATVFALTANADEAAALASALLIRRPSWWIAVARLGALDLTSPQS